ncbi:MAG: alpha/beta hydrolase family protein [Rhodanobacteraceae bacterium]
MDTRDFANGSAVRRLAAWLFLATLAMVAISSGVARASGDLVDDCHLGAYRLADGSLVDIGATDGPHLRWRREDGKTGALTHRSDGTWTSTLGWTDHPDGIKVGFSDCSEGRITFDGTPGKRIALDVANTRFQGAGVTLAGRLVLPKGNGRVPIAVLVHGSEHFSALDFYDLQRMFPALGIGVFVYDKRGTGASGGTYTQDYLLLADDAIAAVREARRLAGARAGRIGYQAGSEGGWVAPLAAKISPVDFVIVGFGLAVSPLDEDREAIAYDMQRQGYGPDVMAKAMQVADATAAILLSNFRSGYDKLDALKKQYGKEPWFKHVHGDVTFALLAMSPEELKQKGPVLLAGAPFQYDPMPVLRHLDTPQLWILGGEDADAPSAETIKRLRGLQEAGRPIALAVYPHAEHGIYEFETKPDGTRVDTRNPDGYFQMMRDYILDGKLHGAYGDAVLHAGS